MKPRRAVGCATGVGDPAGVALAPADVEGLAADADGEADWEADGLGPADEEAGADADAVAEALGVADGVGVAGIGVGFGSVGPGVACASHA